MEILPRNCIALVLKSRPGDYQGMITVVSSEGRDKLHESAIWLLLLGSIVLPSLETAVYLTYPYALGQQYVMKVEGFI